MNALVRFYLVMVFNLFVSGPKVIKKSKIISYNTQLQSLKKVHENFYNHLPLYNHF